MNAVLCLKRPHTLLRGRLALQTLALRSFSSSGEPAPVSPGRQQIRPRASNPKRFQTLFEPPPQIKRSRSRRRRPKSQDGAAPVTLADHLYASGQRVPGNDWVRIDNIPPLSSLDAMIRGVSDALDREQGRGMVDLDAAWNPNNKDPLPFLSVPDNSQWVKKALIVLSPFGRPTGWKLQLENRSVVHALLSHANETPVVCGHKNVSVRELPKYELNQTDNYPQVSDATVRVENCPDSATSLTLLNLFSRYDLRTDGPSVVQWSGQTSDGKIPPPTWLVYFADAAWARAALRERQGAIVDGRALLLAQYPKQML